MGDYLSYHRFHEVPCRVEEGFLVVLCVFCHVEICLFFANHAVIVLKRKAYCLETSKIE